MGDFASRGADERFFMIYYEGGACVNVRFCIYHKPAIDTTCCYLGVRFSESYDATCRPSASSTERPFRRQDR